jgi:predicted alpha/beta-fold hydrolase
MTGNILDIVEHLIKGSSDSNSSFDVVVINWRGLGGMKL